MTTNALRIVPTIVFALIGVTQCFAGESRRDFEGRWRNSHGQIFRITQYDNSSVLVSDLENNKNYGVVFGKGEVPNDYIDFQKNRTVNDNKIDVIQSGSYTSKLSVDSGGSTADANLHLELSIPFAGSREDMTIAALGSAKAPKKQSPESECQGVFRPRALIVSVKGFKVQTLGKGVLPAVANFLFNIGAKVGIGKLTYNETLVEEDPNPAQTAVALAKCGRYDADYAYVKHLPPAPTAPVATDKPTQIPVP